MITYFNCATASFQQCLLALDIMRLSVVISLSFLTFRKAENNYTSIEFDGCVPRKTQY